MKLKPLLILFFSVCFLIFFSSVTTGETTLGGALENDFTGDELWYGGYLRTGGLIKLELGGLRSESSNSKVTRLFSYLLLDLNLGSLGTNTGSLHLYLGGSPDMTLNADESSFSFSDSSGFGKAGLSLRIFPLSIQVQATGKFDFSGNLTSLFGGVGLGLTF